MNKIGMAQELQLDNYFIALFYDNESGDILLKVTDTLTGEKKKIRLRSNDYLKLMTSFILKDYRDLKTNFSAMLSKPKSTPAVKH